MTFLKFLRCCNFAGSIFSLKIKRACHAKFFHSKIGTKILYNMRTAYFQCAEGEQIVHVTVNLSDFNISKVLNFERNILEKLVDFMKKLDYRLNTLHAKKLTKKKLISTEDISVLKTSLLLNNEQVPDDVVFQDLFQNNFNGDLKIRISDIDYNVIINSPLVLTMALPKNLLVGCTVGPEGCKVQSTDFGQSEFVWYQSKNPTKPGLWEICGKGPYYKIKEKDLDHYLKLLCIPKLNERQGPGFEVISKTPVERFDNLNIIYNRLEFTKEKTKADEIRIVSYNILADLYVNTKEAKTQIFTFCNPDYLEFDYRKNLLYTELQGYNADILCMQEVERKFYSSNLLLFNYWGYEALYHEKEGTREGSAVLFDRNKFNVITAAQYTLTRELLSNPLFSDIKLKIENNKKLVERLSNVTSQLQVIVFECFNSNVLVVGNVHFYFHPDADHIRLLQGIMSWRLLLNTAQEVKKMEANKVSIILCGDFNSTPDCGFHQLLSGGSVDSSHIDWKSKEGEKIEGVSYSHSVKMKSCYEHTILTNYIPSFKACIDYIYFQSDHLELKQTVPVPGEDVLSRFGGIPSQYLPSDHVALVADLKFKEKS